MSANERLNGEFSLTRDGDQRARQFDETQHKIETEITSKREYHSITIRLFGVLK